MHEKLSEFFFFLNQILRPAKNKTVFFEESKWNSLKILSLSKFSKNLLDKGIPVTNILKSAIPLSERASLISRLETKK